MYRNNYKLTIYSAFSVISSEFPGFSAPRCNTAWRRVEQWHGSISGAELRPEMTSHFSAQTVPCAGMARRRPVRSSLIRASRDTGAGDPRRRRWDGGRPGGRRRRSLDDRTDTQLHYVLSHLRRRETGSSRRRLQTSVASCIDAFCQRKVPNHRHS